MRQVKCHSNFHKVAIIGAPLDLGANIRGANMGPPAIRIAGLHQGLLALGYSVTDYDDIMVPTRESIPTSVQEKKYLPLIADLCSQVASRVEKSLSEDQYAILLGGDHSIAIGSISGSSAYAKKHGLRLGVIWIDAHADINTPESSPSGNIHGMPLGALLGEGHPELTEILGPSPKINPQDVVLIGVRNIDEIEKVLVQQSGVVTYTMRHVDEKGIAKIMEEVLSIHLHSCDILHVSFDLDGVDPLYAPGVSTPVPGGLSYREAHLALEIIADSNKMCACDFVELNPMQDHSHQTAKLCVELIQSVLGKSIV
jgi:arginase